jgi:hypothetical protein
MSKRSLSQTLLLSLISASAVSLGCAVSAKTNETAPTEKVSVKNTVSTTTAPNEIKTSVAKNSIDFTADSPAETIRVYFMNLREKRFREALMLTNLRVAVENLSAAEEQDLGKDFAALAEDVPAQLQVSGEIVTGDKATVTVKLPNEETGAFEDQIFNLQRENGKWIYMMADAATEATAKKEGKNYFFALRIEVHHAQARQMIERIAKAQVAYFVQNNSTYGELPALVERGLVPPDVQNTESTGYRFGVALSPDKKKYTATAEPAVYGKSGNLSFLLQVDDKGKNAGIKSKDNKGMPLKN